MEIILFILATDKGRRLDNVQYLQGFFTDSVETSDL